MFGIELINLDDVPWITKKEIEDFTEELLKDTEKPCQGRNNALKAQVVAAIYSGKIDDQIIKEIVSYDLENHTPPLFTDRTDPQMKLGSAEKNAGRFIKSIRTSVAKEESSSPVKAPKLKCLGDVKPREVDFLWKPYLPKGKLAALIGDPGIGKSTYTLFLAARITTGQYFLSDSEPKRDPANVVFFTTEDDDDDTIVPRLNRFKADNHRVFLCDEVITFDEKGLNHVEQFLERTRPALVVIDPIQVYIKCADMNRANETRSFLAPLAALAKKFKCAILVVMHMNKGGEGKAIYRGLGSIDFIGCCRSALAAAELNDGRRVIVHIKSNVAALGPSLSYQTTNGQYLLSLEPSVTARDIQGSSTPERKASPLSIAEEFVEEMLSQMDPYPSKDLRIQAKKVGIALRTLKRAYKNLKVRAFKKGDDWFKTLKEGGQDESD